MLPWPRCASARWRYSSGSHSSDPILQPEAPYEREGFFGNVVFTCGAVPEPDGRIILYYGAADECIAAAETSVDDLLSVIP